jgi:hypothetical protein
MSSPSTFERFVNRPQRSPERRIYSNRRLSRSPEPRVVLRYQTGPYLGFLAWVSVGLATRFCRLVRFFINLWKR